MKIRGVLKTINDTVKVNNDFCRRNAIIETSDRGHTESISIEFYQDHCKMLDEFKEDSHVVVDFNLKGRKWTNNDGVTKYFNTLQGWKIAIDENMDE